MEIINNENFLYIKVPVFSDKEDVSINIEDFFYLEDYPGLTFQAEGYKFISFNELDDIYIVATIPSTNKVLYVPEYSDAYNKEILTYDKKLEKYIVPSTLCLFNKSVDSIEKVIADVELSIPLYIEKWGLFDNERLDIAIKYHLIERVKNLFSNCDTCPNKPQENEEEV